jgi:uncharacterized membrane protein YphA (DoxX/SURF4 family)
MQITKPKSRDGWQLANRLFIVLRCGFGLVFIFSGSIKLANLADFAKALSNFEIIPEPLISFVVILIPITEILVGAAILLGLRTALARSACGCHAGHVYGGDCRQAE